MGGPNGGGGTPSLVNQAIAPPPRSSLSPTGSTCSNTSSTSYNLASAAAVALNGHTATNSSTVQLSPASSISSLSSTSNGVPALVTPTNVATPIPCATSMKSNYGLITIKGKTNNILTTQKFVKLLATTTPNTTHPSGIAPAMASSAMIMEDNSALDGNGGRSSSNALLGQGGPPSQSLPNLVNLGILTPATSPRNGTTGQVGGTVMGVVAGSNSSSGCSSMSSMSNSSMESLPLTPVSPTIGKSEAFISVAQELISGSSVTDSDHNMSDNT